MSLTIKNLRARIEELEIENTKLVIALEDERDLVTQLTTQLENMAEAEIESRNHKRDQDFEWYE